MATYLFFDYNAYYPGGGSNDLRAVFEAPDDDAAMDRAREIARDARSLGEYVDVVSLDADGGWEPIYDGIAHCLKPSPTRS